MTARSIPHCGILLSLLACSPEVELGAVPGVLWSTDNERGELGDWTDDKGGWTFVTSKGALVEPVSHPVHRGRHAVSFTIDPPDGATTQALLYRLTDYSGELYFGAWFYVPVLNQTAFWTVMKIRSSGPGCPQSWGWDDWDVFLSGKDDKMFVGLYEHETGTMQLSKVELPIAQWVHLRLRVQPSATATGTLALWQNETLVCQLENVVTTKCPPTISFGVGSVANVLSPSPATLFLDDALLSTADLVW